MAARPFFVTDYGLMGSASCGSRSWLGVTLEETCSLVTFGRFPDSAKLLR
jgi:hypothetical protein